jgi:hypothetical protein
MRKRDFSIGLDLGVGHPDGMRNTVLQPPRDASPFGMAGKKNMSTYSDNVP